jgi:transcription-repair coupling factor (superfamily II helicase)
MRDLEIRGAGNLLGAEQSGHITAVGFELYCQLLKQSVASLKGEKVKPRLDVQVRLDFLSLTPAEEFPSGQSAPLTVDSQAAPPPASAYIPFSYIADSRQRIEFYRKLAQLEDQMGIERLEKELRDRFGPPPVAMEMLLNVGGLKLLAAERGITAIEVKEDKVMLTRNNDYVMVGSKFPRLTKKDAAGRLKEIRKLLKAL